MTPRFLASAALCALLPSHAFAISPPAQSDAPGALCLPAVAAAEQAERLPQHLLRSISYVESGRTDPQTGRAVPWPWTINVGGTGTFYPTKEEAVAAVRQLQASGVRSIDVGCAQVNLQHHPAAFASLDAAFDPAANTLYAARFLNALRRGSGSWPLAAAGYHSQTVDIGYAYARKVIAIWPGAARYGELPPAPLRPGAAPQPAAPDYTMYTPRFAAWMRQMDEDRARIMGQVGPRPALAAGQRRVALQTAPTAQALPRTTGWKEASLPRTAPSGPSLGRVLEW